MILQALVDYYEALSIQGAISSPGWGPAKVSFALYLHDSGALEQAVCVKTEQLKGKKTVLLPQTMQLPALVKRSSGIDANFLCDNSGYLLGVDAKGNPQRSRDCFSACKALHEQVLTDADSPAAQALLAFFQTWEPDKALEHPALQEHLEELLSGANLVFRYGGTYLQDDPAIRQAWQAHYNADGGGPEMTCLVTGETGPVAQLHPSIKGVQGAQSSGASLVSFNAPSLESYGHEQGENAPTGKYAAFAYGTALNHLLSDWQHVYHMGDTTVICWAKGGASAYQTLFGGAFFAAPVPYSNEDLQKMVSDLCQGTPVLFEESRLDPQTEFYILGLSPNAARLSVRFFLRNSFGSFLRNIQAHQQRLAIVHPSWDTFENLPLWKLLDETVNHNSLNKSPIPNLAGETLRSILNNTRYPATLLNGVTLRIRAEQEITRGRAAIIKAYYLKHPHPDIPEEVLIVSLNPESTNVPYALGRLFSVLEAIQQTANPGINATIKDKYFNAASSTPATIFPILGNLAQKHLKKLKGSNVGLCVFYEKQLSELADLIGESYPTRMNLPQQGSFQLGYYHQTAARYQKKEEQ